MHAESLVRGLTGLTSQAAALALFTLAIFASFGGVIGCGGSGGGDAADGGDTGVAVQKKGRIVFFGDSLTEGYQIRPDQAYPALISDKTAQAGIPNPVLNAGISGNTSADGLARIDGVTGEQIALFFLALGANDSRHGVSADELQHNLQAIIDRVRAASPQAVIVVAGIVPLVNRGPEYETAFLKVFPDVAAANQATLMPFLLEGVFGHSEFYTIDEIHPNAAGHRVMADSVWKVIQPLL